MTQKEEKDLIAIKSALEFGDMFVAKGFIDFAFLAINTAGECIDGYEIKSTDSSRWVDVINSTNFNQMAEQRSYIKDFFAAARYITIQAVQAIDKT